MRNKWICYLCTRWWIPPHAIPEEREGGIGVVGV